MTAADGAHTFGSLSPKLETSPLVGIRADTPAGPYKRGLLLRLD